MLLLDILSSTSNPYLGIVTYLILPVAAGAGAGLMFLGVAWERRRRKRHPGLTLTPLPSFDLNMPRQRTIAAGLLAFMSLAVILTSVTSYRAYNFSESVTFCGLACHQVMNPEYTAYLHSPHARVACVACHIGPGASWFVRSKITGAYQVYAVTFNKYPRPISTPIKNLRPAQETCEQCHWPAKFFGAQQRTFHHFLSDEKNSPWDIQMLVRIGGGDPKTGAVSGIHWHMNIKNEIFYLAADEKRETIPWVRVVAPSGHVTDYRSTENPLSAEQIAKAKPRRMDCMDCHNRPSHVFRAPDRAVEESFGAGRLDPALPYLKREAVRLLTETYASQTQAAQAIGAGLDTFYKKSYPAIYRDKEAAIRKAIGELQQLYSTNFFPEMHADWRAYPTHIGHMTSDGCFRCHDGLHQSKEGKVITKDCSACHTILAQGPPPEAALGRLQAQLFRHPVDVGVDVKELKCGQCHAATN